MGRIDRHAEWSAGGASGWSMFESFHAATHVLTADGLIVEANPAFERMFGAPRSVFCGRHQSDLCDGPRLSRQRLTSRILRQAASGGTWQGVIESLGAAGRRFTTRAHVYPARVDGRTYFVCIQEEPGLPAPAGALDGGASPWRSLAAPG